MKRQLLLLAVLPLLLMAACKTTGSSTDTGNSTDLPAQDRQSGGWRGRRGGVPELSGLTDTQKEQIQKIQETSRQQTDTVLTAAQKEQMRQARTKGQRPNLNLSEEQRAKMSAIRQETDKQIEAVLTEEQRQQWQQLRQQRQQRRQQRQQQ